MVRFGCSKLNYSIWNMTDVLNLQTCLPNLPSKFGPRSSCLKRLVPKLNCVPNLPRIWSGLEHRVFKPTDPNRNSNLGYPCPKCDHDPNPTWDIPNQNVPIKSDSEQSCVLFTTNSKKY